MFEHLDDPHPPPSPERMRAAVHRTVRRRRRRRASVVGGVAVVVGLGGAAVVAARDRVTPEQVTIDALPPAAERPEPGEPMTVLMVGTDSTGPGDAGQADTVVLARIDLALEEVRLLPVPRDLQLAGPSEAPDVARDVFEAGGPSRLIEAVETDLGVTIDHYVGVDFMGAVDLVDAIGGIRVAVDRSIRDEPTGLALGEGCHTLDGEGVLALGRARHVQVEVDGTWLADPGSDRSRQQRATVVAGSLLQALGRIGLADLPAVVDAGLQSVVVDDALELDDVQVLARQVRDDRIVSLTLPVEDAIGPDGGEVLRLGVGVADVVTELMSNAATPVPGEDDFRPLLTIRPC